MDKEVWAGQGRGTSVVILCNHPLCTASEKLSRLGLHQLIDCQVWTLEGKYGRDMRLVTWLLFLASEPNGRSVPYASLRLFIKRQQRRGRGGPWRQTKSQVPSGHGQ